MKRHVIQPIIDEARARRAETPATGEVIQRAFAASQQEEHRVRRPFRLALSLALAGTIAVGFGVSKLHTQPSVTNAKPSVTNAKPSVTNAKPSVTNAKPSVTNTKPSVANAKPHATNAKPSVANAKPSVANAKPSVIDDLDIINNGGSEAAIQRWAQLPQDEQTAQLERIKAIVKGGDDFINVPLPMVATTATAAAAEALANYEAERQIVDGRLAQGVTLGVKALSFTELCDELTRKTGVTFTAAPSVADDKITVFCTKRPVRDLMREITNLFGFTWNRSGQPDAYSYRLTQPVKAQLAEQELRNKNNNVVYLEGLSFSSKEAPGKETLLEAQTLQGEFKIVFDPASVQGESKTAYVHEVPLKIQPGQTKAAFVVDPAHSAASFADVYTLYTAPPTRNAERNTTFKTRPEFTRKVTITPVPGEREPRLPDEKAVEPLVTTADLLEAIHKTTGKDVIGDYFTRLELPQRLTAKNLPLFEALNTVCEPVQLQWSQERGFFQFRSTDFFESRAREVPKRFLEGWALSRRMNRGLKVADLAEIATLRDEQLDAPRLYQGVSVIHNLQEWTLATAPALRPHWRFFASLTPEQQKSALTPEGLAFRELRQAQQWELLRLAFEKKDNISSVATQLSSIRLCVEKTRFVYHYTRPDGTTSQVVFAATP